MIKSINLGEREKSIKALEILKNEERANRDIQITNSHITDLNELVKRKIFKNNLLYISSQTIHDLMQPAGGKRQHNYHDLTAEDIYISLSSIKDPECIFITKQERYALISIELSHFDLPLMLVLETNAKLVSDIYKEINKVVTIYPKDHVDSYIEKLDERLLLYKKD